MAETDTKETRLSRREAATREHAPEEGLAAARRTFLRELSAAEQWRLLEELVETRSGELCRAYPAVVDVSFGYGTRRARKGQGTVLKRKPCVTFTVKRKWRGKRSARSDEEPLPKYLYAYWTVRGRRTLCAVPTDVEDASVPAGIGPQASSAGLEVRSGDKTGEGVFACTIRRTLPDNEEVFGDRIYAVSCRHVFSPSLKTPGREEKWNEGVRRANGATPFASTRGIAGPLVEDPPKSFDAQLAQVTDRAEWLAALGKNRLSGHVSRMEEIPDSYFILTPRGPITAKKKRMVFSFPIPYARFGLEHVVHVQLIESEALTRGGDSGSPVATTRNGGLLLGMHIAGGDGVAYMIPAWRLLSPRQYQRAANTEIWKLVNPGATDEVEVVAPRAPSGLSLGVNTQFAPAIEKAAARTGLDPAALAALIDAEAAKNRNGVWNPNSRNTRSTALGLTQFLSATWLDMAKKPTTLLNETARAKGLVSAANRVASAHEARLLDLRTDAELSIVTAAEYGEQNLKGLASAGLLAPNASDDERARLAYLAHHEGLTGAKRFLNKSITENGALSRLKTNVGDSTRARLIATHGDARTAYISWLNEYMDKKIQPAKFRA